MSKHRFLMTSLETLPWVCISNHACQWQLPRWAYVRSLVGEGVGL